MRPVAGKVLILCAGQGRRYAAGGGEGHKALAPVLGTTPLLWTLGVLERAGAPDVCVVVGHHAQAVRRAVRSARYPGELSFVANNAFEQTDSAHSFALGAEHLGGPLLLTYGDVLLTEELLDRFLVCPDGDFIAVDRSGDPGTWDMLSELAGGKIVRLGKQLPAETACGESACLFRFRADTTDELASLCRQSLDAPAAMQFEQVLSGVLHRVNLRPVWCTREEWCEVDVPADLVRARRLVARSGIAAASGSSCG